MYEHLSLLKEKLLKLEVESPPEPWQLKNYIAVGGLMSVGFDRDSDNLLIVSSQGRGVVNCINGKKVARNRDEYYEEKHYRYLEAEGIGILNGKSIKMSGLFGGGLLTSTEDGWQLDSVTLNWPEEMILLTEPGSDLYGSTFNYPDNFTKIEQDSTIRAYGFSCTNESFVIATSSDVAIYSRKKV